MNHEQIEGLEIGERIGRGGEGIVYKARQTAIDRPVAVKFQHSKSKRDLDDSSQFEVSLGINSRFDNEMTYAGRIHYDSVVPIYHGRQLGPDPNQGDFMILKLIVDEKGQTCTLQDLIDRRLLLNGLENSAEFYRSAVTNFLDVVRGLKAVHNEGIVHCDIKPRNVLVGENSKLYLSDFGLAINRGTQTNPNTGSRYFVAPEQIVGHPDYHSDVFSIGLTLALYLGSAQPRNWVDACCQLDLKTDEAVDGVDPRTLEIAEISKRFTSVTATQTNPSIPDKSNRSPKLCSLPDEKDFRASSFCPDAPRFLRNIVDQATKRKTAERTPTVAQFEQQLVDFLAGKPSPDDPLRFPKSCIFWTSNNLHLLSGLAMAMGLAFLIWWVWVTYQTQQQRDFTERSNRFEEGQNLLDRGFTEEARTNSRMSFKIRRLPRRFCGKSNTQGRKLDINRRKKSLRNLSFSKNQPRMTNRGSQNCNC